MDEMGAAQVGLAEHPDLGSILVDASGRVVYLFTKDERDVTNCYGQCALNWPPLLTVGDPTAGEGVAADRLGVIERTDGAMQVTYNGWPLYSFARDEKPGDATGQDVGGVWYVVSAEGEAVMSPAMGMEPTATPPSAEARVIEVAARLVEFSPAEITVKAGELIKLVITSEDVFHTFTIDELGIDVSIGGGQTGEVELTAPESGTLRFYCKPHVGAGMEGDLHVESGSEMGAGGY